MPSSTTPAVTLTREQLVGLEQILRKLDVRSASEFMLAPAKRVAPRAPVAQPERKDDGSVNWTQNLVAWKDAAGKARNKAGAWITHCVTEGHPKGCTCNLLDPNGIMALPARATAPARKVPTAAFPQPTAPAAAPEPEPEDDLAEQVAGMLRDDPALFARVIALLGQKPAAPKAAAPAAAPVAAPTAAPVAGPGERICRKGHVAPARELCPTCAAKKAA